MSISIDEHRRRLERWIKALKSTETITGYVKELYPEANFKINVSAEGFDFEVINSQQLEGVFATSQREIVAEGG